MQARMTNPRWTWPNDQQLARQQRTYSEPDAARIRSLRGRIEWHHPDGAPTDLPSIGTCMADLVEDHGWYIVWTEDWRDWDSGGHWTTDLGGFIPLDAIARELLRWVSSRRAPSVPTSPWHEP